MATGTLDIYLALDRNGDPMRGDVPKGMRARARFTNAGDVRTFYDPLASRNLSNALPTPARRAPVAANVAPAGWRLRPDYAGPSADDLATYADVAPVRKARAPRVMARAATPAEIAASAPIAIAPAVPDALATCNTCDLAPMVGPEHAGYAAGQCVDCYAAATAPEPTYPTCGACNDRTADPIGCPDGLCAPCRDAETVPEPVAPESIAPPVRLASVPAPVMRERPTCERCGQTFRASGNGAEWHRVNRPDCASSARPVLAIAR